MFVCLSVSLITSKCCQWIGHRSWTNTALGKWLGETGTENIVSGSGSVCVLVCFCTRNVQSVERLLRKMVVVVVMVMVVVVVVVCVCALLCVCTRNVQSVERLLRRTAAAITWCVSAASSTSAGSVSARGNHTARRGTSGSFGCRRRTVACLYMFASKNWKQTKLDTLWHL